MSLVNESEMHRSVSMPDKPKYLEPKALQRSKEKESLIDEEQLSMFEYRKSWQGSTIELNSKAIVKGNESCYLRNRQSTRVISKKGRENINFRSIPDKSKRYIKDLVTTLIELKWKYMLTLFLGSYFACWYFFAILCYLVAYYHGDLTANATSYDEVLAAEASGPPKLRCIQGTYDFTSILIYSIETQTTIGFGEKYPTEECPETIVLFIVQILCAIAIEGGMISIIYAKTARPAKQMTKLKFSKKAVVCHRDGKLCLMFRVCDIREQQTIDSKIRLYMIVDRITSEGEITKCHTELKLQGNGQQIITWPEIVCHVVDESSPLHKFTTAKQLNAAQFELYVSIVGASPATAQFTEARTSYLPNEIYWGQRFVNIINYDAVAGHYTVDYGNFNTTISVDMNTMESYKTELIPIAGNHGAKMNVHF